MTNCTLFISPGCNSSIELIVPVSDTSLPLLVTMSSFMPRRSAQADSTSIMLRYRISMKCLQARPDSRDTSRPECTTLARHRNRNCLLCSRSYHRVMGLARDRSDSVFQSFECMSVDHPLVSVFQCMRAETSHICNVLSTRMLNIPSFLEFSMHECCRCPDNDGLTKRFSGFMPDARGPKSWHPEHTHTHVKDAA